MWFHCCWVEGNNHPHQNASNSSSRIPVCSWSPLLQWHPAAHCELCTHQNSRAFLCQATFQLFSPKTIQEHGVFLPQVQDLAFPCTELHSVPDVPFLQLLEIPLNNRHISLLYQSLLSSTDFLRIISVPSPRSLMNMSDSSSWASTPRARHF